MKLRYEKSFLRDIKRLREEVILRRLEEVLTRLKDANSLSEISGCKRLKGFDNLYRIKIGSYRLGIADLGDGEIAILRFMHRREIYRRFP